MTARKSYGQFCGLARSLDRIGDRWTLLIVRELLLGDRTFRELQDALPGLSPSLLTSRLRELADEGLLVRSDAPRRSKKVAYGLTEAGRSLEMVVVELIRWGTRWMLSGPGDDVVDARWAPLALRALLEDHPSVRGRIHLDVDGIEVTITGTGRRRHVTVGHHGDADATIAAALPVILDVATGGTHLESSAATIAGDAALARELLTVAARERQPWPSSGDR